jgi:hypothetical protein
MTRIVRLPDGYRPVTQRDTAAERNPEISRLRGDSRKEPNLRGREILAVAANRTPPLTLDLFCLTWLVGCIGQDHADQTIHHRRDGISRDQTAE